MNTAGTVSGALGGDHPSAAAADPAEDGSSAPAAVQPGAQPSRTGTKAITVHFPEAVRRQLKAMAGEQGRDVADVVAEGLNLVFVKYQKPPLAPRKSYK